MYVNKILLTTKIKIMHPILLLLFSPVFMYLKIALSLSLCAHTIVYYTEIFQL